jgi:acetylornithine deacetylase/succinyl-diaminopimelate desuccinylase-like protein
VTELQDRVKAEIPRALEDLRALVAIPSISSMPDHADDVLRSAEATCELFRAEGVDARVVTTGGARPAVIGHKAGPAGSPTVLLYGHHDVQPLGSGWSRDPWSLTADGDRLYGRGSSDDKGAIALHLAVLRAFGDELPVSVTVLVEGEEEIGSPAFAELLAGHVDELRADAIVCPDAVNPTPLQPSLTTDLRGNVAVVVTLSTIARPVHSGLYGGVLPCALTTLVQLLATLHDADGRLAVEGLAPSSVEPPAVLVDYADLLLDGVQELPGGSLAERLVTSPSVTVLAVDAVPVAEASNVLHPRAAAKLGIRVPPDGDPQAVLEAIEAHLRSHVRHGAQLEIARDRAGLGFHGKPRSDAWTLAAKEAFGTDSVDVGAGGSIPFLSALQAVNPDADFFVTAVQDSGSQAHSFDESLHVPGFEAACVAHALLLRSLGTP